MARIHHHRDRSILIFEDPQERMEVPAEGSYVVCRFGGGFAGFWLDANESIALSGPVPLPTIEDALRPVLESLDRLWEAEERERVEHFESAVAQAALPAPQPDILERRAVASAAAARHRVALAQCGPTERIGTH